jgi:hypothetical protein
MYVMVEGVIDRHLPVHRHRSPSLRRERGVAHGMLRPARCRCTEVRRPPRFCTAS